MKEQDLSYSMLTNQHTPNWLRSFDGCSHLSETEAQEILNSLDKLAGILLPVAQRMCSQQTAAVIMLPGNNTRIIKKAA